MKKKTQHRQPNTPSYKTITTQTQAQSRNHLSAASNPRIKVLFPLVEPGLGSDSDQSKRIEHLQLQLSEGNREKEPNESDRRTTIIASTTAPLGTRESPPETWGSRGTNLGARLKHKLSRYTHQNTHKRRANRC